MIVSYYTASNFSTVSGSGFACSHFTYCIRISDLNVTVTNLSFLFLLYEYFSFLWLYTVLHMPLNSKLVIKRLQVADFLIKTIHKIFR